MEEYNMCGVMSYVEPCDVDTEDEQLPQRCENSKKYFIGCINALRFLYLIFKENENVLKGYKNNELRIKFIKELMKDRHYSKYRKYFTFSSDYGELGISNEKMFFKPLIFHDTYIESLSFDSYVLIQIETRIIDLIIRFLKKSTNPDILNKSEDLSNFFEYHKETAISDFYHGFPNPYTIVSIRNITNNYTSRFYDLIADNYKLIFGIRGSFELSKTNEFCERILNKENDTILFVPNFQIMTDIIESPKPFKIDIHQYDSCKTPQDYIDSVNKSIADGFKNSESAIKLCFEKSVELFDKLIEKT